MIDDALGWKPAVRRRRDDGTSQSSNKPGTGAEVVRQAPTSNISRRSAKQQASPKEEPQPAIKKATLTSSRQSGRLSAPEPVHAQNISSPQIKKPRVVQIHQQSHGRNSLSRSSVRLAEQEKKKQAQKSDQMYKLKLIIFLIISIFVMFQTMTPSRKVPYKAKRR